MRTQQASADRSRSHNRDRELNMQCTRCEQENPAGARFCNQCGTALSSPVEAERRQLTVMFCDLADSTALSAALDPESLRELLTEYQAAAGAEIARHEGHVAQYLGDGMLVYFGYPVAQEDAAARAMRAGLGILRALDTLNASRAVRQGSALRVRIGIHTGSVVIGDVGHGSRRERLALGETPNIAARLQALAAPDSVLVSEVTRRLSKEEFSCADFGSHLLKGLTEPLQVWRVQSASVSVIRRASTPLVGRIRELALLYDRWQMAQSGDGQGVLILGEPGMGKTRLCHAIQEEALAAGARVLHEGCSQLRSGSPLVPLVRMLSHASGVGGRSDAQGTASLAASLEELGLKAADLLPFLAPLLSLPCPADLESQDLSPQAQREKTFDALLRWVHALASAKPLLLVLEDLQWADPSTLEFMSRLLRGSRLPSVLVLCTARADFRPEFPLPMEEMSLGPCLNDELETLVQSLSGPEPFSKEVLQEIVSRAGGVPLFAQELARSMRETGRAGVPATLQDLLMARLDRLGPARTVAQQAAVIGRAFSLAMLEAVTGHDRQALRAALQQALELGLIVDEPDAPAQRYTFAHALFADIAYHSMLRPVRQQTHQRTAAAICQFHPHVAEQTPEVLAHHFAEAGMPAEAAANWLKAARKALAASACLEAIAHAKSGLVAVQALPPDPGCAALTLEFHLLRAPALMAVRGAAAAEVEEAYSQAGEACKTLGDTPKLIVPLWGLWAYALMRGQLMTALDRAQQIDRLAQRQPAGDSALIAAETMGMTRFYMGDLRQAQAVLRRGRLAVSVPRSGGRRGRAVHDAGLMCDAFQTLAAWLTGDELEVEACQARLRIGEQAMVPYDRAYYLCFSALLSLLRGHPRQVIDHASQALAIARQQGFPTWAALAQLLRGWGLAYEGDSAQGVSAARKGCSAWDAAGARNLAPLFRTVLADTLMRDGQAVMALSTLDEALEITASDGERWWEAETHRLRARALRATAPHDPSSAIQSLRRAIEVATAQGASSLEARARSDLEEADA